MNQQELFELKTVHLYITDRSDSLEIFLLVQSNEINELNRKFKISLPNIETYVVYFCKSCICYIDLLLLLFSLAIVIVGKSDKLVNSDNELCLVRAMMFCSSTIVYFCGNISRSKHGRKSIAKDGKYC